MASVGGFVSGIGGFASGAYGGAQSVYGGAKSAYSSAMGTHAGREFFRGVGESFGFQYTNERSVGGKPGKLISKGFLGRKAAGGFRKLGVVGALGGALFPAFVAHSAYQGYQEGGVMGAATSAAFDAGMWGAMRAAGSLLMNPITIAAAAVAASGYGYYKYGENVRKFGKRLRAVEMGADVIDTYGTIATTRQRSLAALQNSHINGRLALGNEASILHNPRMLR